MHHSEEQDEQQPIDSSAPVPAPPTTRNATAEPHDITESHHAATQDTAVHADADLHVDSSSSMALDDAAHASEQAPASVGAFPDLTFAPSVTTMSEASEHDPLQRRPKIITLCVSAVFGVLFLALAAGCWWLLVRTLAGQQLDNMALEGFADNLPLVLRLPARALAVSFAVGPVSISVSLILDVVIGVLALGIVCVRKRWRLLVQIVVFATIAISAAEVLKRVLPRTMMDNSTLSPAVNTSPSGHVAIAAVSVCALLCVVPRVWRALCAVFATLYTAEVAFSVIVGGFHRPGDTIAAMLLVFGLACLMLCATGGSGMDAPGTRLSSASIQIVASLMITIGVCALMYAGYVLYQLAPGIMFHAMWATWASHIAMNFIGLALPSLGFGIILALRHATASPLSRLGMLGAPPAPPSRKSASR